MGKETRKVEPAGTVKLRRAGLLIVGAVLLVVAVTAAYRLRNQGTDLSVLAGCWWRPDGGYVLELKDPAPQGRLTAAYLNPNPINVSRAEWQERDGRLQVFVELRDEGYPGSTYTLTYEPESNQLKGVYFQAAYQQEFTVTFQRVGETRAKRR